MACLLGWTVTRKKMIKVSQGELQRCKDMHQVDRVRDRKYG